MIDATRLAILALIAFAGCSEYRADAPPERGTAECPAGTAVCGTTCIDPKNDPTNCGTCGHRCLPSEVCSDGACQLYCGGGTVKCADACVDLHDNPHNCGTCAHACSTGEYCSNGACVLLCGAPTIPCGTSCADTRNDPVNCGACGKACPPGSLCVEGHCDDACRSRPEVCNGVDDNCDGIADFTIVNGRPISACECRTRALSVRSAAGECGQAASCSTPQCPISNGGQTVAMSYSLGECGVPYPWAQCSYRFVDLDSFDADNGASGVLAIDLCIDAPQPGQRLNNVAIYYGAYPGRKKLSLFSEAEADEGIIPGCYTRYFRPSDASCNPEQGLPTSCQSGCTNGRWSDPNRPECRFDYDGVPLWLTAEGCRGTPVATVIRDLRLRLLEGPACTCRGSSDCTDLARPVCNMSAPINDDRCAEGRKCAGVCVGPTG